jgi:hypothetical protein
LANGGRIVWLPPRSDATLRGRASSSTEFQQEPRHGYQVMLNTSDTVRSTQTEDGRIVLDIRRGQMFSLNVVGSRILELIEHGWDEARIADEISRSYAMSIEVVRTDVHDFIDALRKHHIVDANESVEPMRQTNQQ